METAFYSVWCVLGVSILGEGDSFEMGWCLGRQEA